MLTDYLSLATSPNSRTTFYDEVQVTIFNNVSNLVSIDGVSYPSIPSQDYLRLCYINTESPGNCPSPSPSPSPEFEDSECTVLYYEERDCNSSLTQLIERVKERGGRAVIYRTEHIKDQLRRLRTTSPNISVPVILVEDQNFTIRQYRNEVFVLVNITQRSQARPPSDNDEQSTTVFFIVLSVFIALLLVGVVVVSLVIFKCYRRHRDMTRLAVSCPYSVYHGVYHLKLMIVWHVILCPIRTIAFHDYIFRHQ